MPPAAQYAHRSTAAEWWPSLPELEQRAGGENFTVVSLLLGQRTARQLRAIYLFSRLVDECGDAAPGDRLDVLARVEEELDRAYAGTTTDPVFLEVGAAVRASDLPRSAFVRLIEANRQDQRQHDYETYEDLVAYCDLSANPVGELVLHVFGAATPDRIALSDRVCTALQLIEHWQDVREDAGNGRIYLPAEDRRRFGVVERDLLQERAGDALRGLLAFETRRADELLGEGAELVGRLSGRARLAVAGYVAGGRAAIEAIQRAGYDVLAATPRPGRLRRAFLTGTVALAR
jgi:squalene synthase HpnC